MNKDYELELWNKFKELGIKIGEGNEEAKEIANNIKGLKKKIKRDFVEEIIEEIEDTDFMAKEIETVHKVLTIIRYYVKFKISN